MREAPRIASEEGILGGGKILRIGFPATGVRTDLIKIFDLT
jgi:hypothetical protein